MRGIAAVGAVVGIIIVALLWLALGAWVVSINVNDIATYYQANKPAPFWPFFWIMLFGGLTAIGGGSARK